MRADGSRTAHSRCAGAEPAGLDYAEVRRLPSLQSRACGLDHDQAAKGPARGHREDSAKASRQQQGCSGGLRATVNISLMKGHLRADIGSPW